MQRKKLIRKRKKNYQSSIGKGQENKSFKKGKAKKNVKKKSNPKL